MAENTLQSSVNDTVKAESETTQARNEETESDSNQNWIARELWKLTQKW